MNNHDYIVIGLPYVLSFILLILLFRVQKRVKTLRKVVKVTYDQDLFYKTFVGCSYNIEQTAQTLGVSKRTVYRWKKKYIASIQNRPKGE